MLRHRGNLAVFPAGGKASLIRPGVVTQAIGDLGIDPEKADPAVS